MGAGLFARGGKTAERIGDYTLCASAFCRYVWYCFAKLCLEYTPQAETSAKISNKNPAVTAAPKKAANKPSAKKTAAKKPAKAFNALFRSEKISVKARLSTAHFPVLSMSASVF